MTRDERRAMWQSRIEAFKASGESSVTAWCAANDIKFQVPVVCPLYIELFFKWLKQHISTRQIAPTCSSGGAYYMLYLVLFGTWQSTGRVFDHGSS